MPENPYGNLSKWDKQQQNPAAPAGMQQAAGAAQDYASGANPYSNLGKWMTGTEQNPYTANANSWYTGFNAEGTNNGWDTDFTRRFMEGQNEAAKDGTLSTYFEKPHATGVVTWDHTSRDGREQFNFGDIYDNGKKVGNVYDLYDRGDADLAMTPWLFDGRQQARIFSDSDPTARLKSEVAAMREQNNVEIPKALQAAEFQGKIDDRTESIAEGKSQAAVVGGTALASGATGAGVGAALTSWLGPGALLGGGVGFVGGTVVGGVGAWFNRDELDQQAARAYEITKLADQQNGTAAGIATGVKEWSEFSTHMTSPLQQAVHGAVEFTGDNKAGDLKSAFYDVDGKGDSTAPTWAKVAGLTAAVGDGVLQFGSPLTRAMYTAQMGGTIVGESANLAMTGTMFDQTEGRFDNIFKDDKGHFDPVSGAAGIMAIGIDAVQLGGLHGLARYARAGSVATAAGREPLEAVGHRFLLDEAGNIVGKKKTIGFLAPSEQVGYASALRDARVAALSEGRAVSADDIYKAAQKLASGDRKIKAALVNGFGEGYEEVAQTIFESMALDNDPTMTDIRTSFLYGAAGGIGMSMGALAGGPAADARMSARAYVLETIARGEAPDKAAWDAEWSKRTLSEKRVAASGTKADAQLLGDALKRVAKDQSATLAASDLDMARALDATRAMTDKDAKRGSSRTDAYNVMSGRLSAGRVDRDGNVIDGTAPAEALEASAKTIHALLANRLKGLGLQAQSLTSRLEQLTSGPQSDAVAAQIEESTELLRQVRGSLQVGQNVLADVADIVNAIYDEGTAAADAQSLTRQLNTLLESVYRGTAPLNRPADFMGTDAELRLAGAQYATLLSSREPKLDSGSYQALLPRASWSLTESQADNFVQVSTDILAAINGDFDGDKLRAENQLAVSAERFAQLRAGQHYGGNTVDPKTGKAVIDIAARNFDASLAGIMAEGLTSGGQLEAEARGVLANIENAICARYGAVLSPEAQTRVFEEFRKQLTAGSEGARTTLVNELAREAGEAITNIGRTSLRNEWLWISQVVNANLQAYQASFSRTKNADRTGPSDTVAAADIDTPVGKNRRKARAVTDAQTLALFADGNTLFRKFQKIHYTWFNAAVLEAANAAPADQLMMAQFYEELARGVTRSELELAMGDDSIASRTMFMLRRLVEDALNDPDLAGQFSPTTAMTVLANVKVKDFWFDGEEAVTDGREMSLLQVLLKRALEADRTEHARTFDRDPALQAKHARLSALTIPNEAADSVNAQKAFLEVFGATPFVESLGGVVGALAPHTTPEQWLRNYASLDANGRREMERLFTNVPEYLDRKETSNPPYSLSEASRREVSAYRVMLDAMMAVGRALPKERAKVSDAAIEDLRAAHELTRAALLDYRKVSSRTGKARKLTAELVQQMFAENPQLGRSVLGAIPDAAANALYEWRDNQLYVTPWVYEMFAMENSEHAAFFFWKNLMLAKWRATQLGVHEDDSDAPGRAYNKLQSRFQRLMYQFASEVGQPRMKLLLRKMDEDNLTLPEFFKWLNTTPGMKGNYNTADYLPFNDDVADFEADTGGGWVSSRASGDLRVALADMRRNAEYLRENMQFREQVQATDRKILDGIIRARNDDPEATPTDRENLRKLARAVTTSLQLPRGFAPTAMLALGRGVMRSFDAHSSDKGQAPTSFEALGEFQALMDAFAFVPGLERVMETLTAHSISSLRTNVGDLARVAGTAMDANGRPISWAPMTLDQAIEMLDDPRSAPLAKLLLTPTALDIAPNGTLSERVLVEASLKDLLDESHYRSLFPTNDSGVPTVNQAMRLVSMADSRGRTEGGNFDATRLVHDLAITYTSALGRPATEDDNDRLLKQAYVDVAQMLMLVGQLQATPETRDSGLLEKVRTEALKKMRQRRMARALPAFVDAQAGIVVDTWVESTLKTLRLEEEQLQQSLVEMYEGEELTRHSEALRAQYQRNEDRIRGLLNDDLAAATMERFRVTGDENLDRAARAQIVDYVRSMTSFPSRAPESAEIWSKLANQLTDGREPELSVEEWDTLSRSVMGVHLADEVLRVAGHVALPPFPKGDPAINNARFFRYFDPSFAYVLDDLLKPDSPLTASAVWLHTMAEQPRTVLPLKKVLSALDRTMLNPSRYGTWTPGLMSQIVAAHERMDSASAPQGIAAAGNGPKRMETPIQATRRTQLVPGPELLTTVTLGGDLLAADVDPFSALSVQPAGAAEPSLMPLALLNNRFYADVKIDGTSIPLYANNLGFEWSGENEPSGYRYIALERLRAAVEQHAKATGRAPGDLTVELQFFHPDSQPAGPEWMHNAYFEGMAFDLLPDGEESLLGTLWSANGGMIAQDTQRPLDASKKGLRAIQPFRRPDDATLAAIEDLWIRDNDFADMLRSKAALALRYDDGSGAVGIAGFNAMYKHMKLQHIVVGLRDGKPAAMTAEEVIAHQAANGKAADLPLENARLVKLSPDVMRSVLGSTGDQGVARFFAEDPGADPDLTPQFTQIGAEALRRFATGWLSETGTIADTPLAHVGAQRVMEVREMLTDAERNARQDRIIVRDARGAEVRSARAFRIPKAELRDGYLATLRLATGSVETEKSTFDFMPEGLPIAPRDIYQVEHSAALLKALGDVRSRDNYERAWEVSDTGGPDYPGGRLTVDTLDADRPLEHQVVVRDLAWLNLATFDLPERDEKLVYSRVEKALRYLSDTGATIVLGSGNGGGDLRYHASRWLVEHGYAPVRGSHHLYEPVEFSLQSQNERAYESTLTETDTIVPARNVVTFLSADSIGTDENSAIHNAASTKLRDRKVVNNVLQSSAYPNYNIPAEDNLERGLYARALMHLRTVTDPTNAEARALLREMAGADPEGVLKIEEALDRFHQRISSRAVLEPQVGDSIRKGDIIPFVHPDGRVILYRHGFKLPKPEDLRELQDRGGLNVALAKSETDELASANEGVISDIQTRARFGRTLVIEAPLQPLGNKVQLEWNGMKYVVVPTEAGHVTEHAPALFPNGMVVDLFSDLASADSKEAVGGRAWNYRNALAFFQYDFTDDLVKFFYPEAKAGDALARTNTVNLLHELADQTDYKIATSDAAALAKANVAIADLLGEFAAVQEQANSVPATWTERFAAPADASSMIAKAVITYLLTPGAHVDNVLRSAGFSHPRAADASVTTRRVPGLFADLLDHGLDSEVHTELHRRFDAQLQRNADGSGWKLHPDWTVEMFAPDGRSIRGYLQFGEAHSSGDNPLLDGQAYDANASQQHSLHNAMAAANSIGAATAHKVFAKSRSFVKSFSKGNGLSQLASGDSVWDALTALPNEKTAGFEGWRRETPAESVRRRLAREEIVGLYHPLNTEGESWTPEQKAEYESAAQSLLARLGLYGSQLAMVDTWVRMHLGSPHAIDDAGRELGVISGSDALQQVKIMRDNVKDGLLPTAGAMIPLIDVNHLTTIYLANLNRAEDRAWAPRTETAKDSARANSWDAWVECAFGTAWIMGADENGPAPEPQFDVLYLLAVDGLMHGYQGATTSTRYLPVSSDTLRQRLLVDPETNKQLVSISADENMLATDPTLFNASRADLEDIVGGQRIYADGRHGADPASAKGRKLKYLDRWRNEVDAPRQANKKMRGVRAGGQTFLGHTTTTNAFWRTMINLKVAKSLFNVALIVAAPMDAWYRRTIDTVAAAAQGESSGAIGKAQVRLADRFAGTSIGQIAQALGLQPMWENGDQLMRANKLVDALSTRTEFKEMVFGEMYYQMPVVHGVGKLEKKFEHAAKVMGRSQDPSWGMPPKDMARTYVDTIVAQVAKMQTGENVYSIDRLIRSLANDPQWVLKNDRELHNMAVARISNIRSLKPNVISLATRGISEPLSSNPKFLWNSAGNMVRLMTVFQNYWSNFAVNMLGLQGAADFVAFMVDGKEKSKLVRRAQAAMAGKTFDETETDYYDMTEVLESVDLADAFIRGGVTHTALFALGMLAGGLGLSGEDDEEKWRRRQAKLQGAGFVHDPRKLANDYRNRDSVYLNWLPLGLDSLFKVDPSNPDSDAMAQMNWITRTILSPVIGFERFYETGDFSEVVYGFKDAIGAHPIVNEQLWKAATDTAAQLHEQAASAAENGDNEAANHFLVTAVGVLDSYMLENSMINMIYVGADRYDRDPYKIPKLDSDKNPQGDVRGNSVPTDVTTPVKGPDGEYTDAFVERDAYGANVRALSENRFGVALLGSLFTGMTGGGFTGSDMWRRNMVPKIRQVELQPTDRQILEAEVLAAYQGTHPNSPVVTGEELGDIWKNQASKSGEWVNWNDVENKALAAAKHGLYGTAAPFDLSQLDQAGREQLTTEGKQYVVNGLRSGSVQLGSPALAGVYITADERTAIQNHWMKQLTQDGVDLGLSPSQATSRMKRIFFGDYGQHNGIYDILWDKRIPSSDTLRYNQLNTTYTMSPSGYPIATGFTRDGLFGALGLKPVNRAWSTVEANMGVDTRGNAVDMLAGVNTGLRALEPRPENWELPSTEDEIRAAAEKMADAIGKLNFQPQQPWDKKSSGGSGWVNYGHGYGGYSHHGYGGGGGGGYYPNYNRLYALPGNISVYGNSIPFINTSNPILRRADVRRERIWSERGRLKQWQ